MFHSRPDYSDHRDHADGKFSKEYSRKDDYRDPGPYKRFKNGNNFREGKLGGALKLPFSLEKK